MDSIKEEWVCKMLLRGYSEAQALVLWDDEARRMEWEAYLRAQEAYELMREEGETPH